MENENFFTNIVRMTFDGKGMFWAVCGIILVIVLLYMFSSRIREVLAKTKHTWLILPVLILGVIVYTVISTNQYVPLSQRSEENPVTYDWEITAKGKKLKYTTDIKDPVTGQAYDQEYALKVKDVFGEGALTEALTVASEDETTEITFNPDGTYRFRALESGAEETGEYIYRDKVLTLSNASGSAAFSKNLSEWFSKNTGWVVLFCLAVLVIILTFRYNRQIKAFLKKHPLVWLLIPAALLIYFVYVAIGWNIWVSVSDWPDGQLEPSYGWGGFGQFAKMFGGYTGESFWNAVKNTMLLFLIIPICLLLGLGLALVMDHGLKGTPAFRTLILLPFSLSFVVTGAIWQQMYRGDNGIIKGFFALFGVDTSGVQWMSSDMVMISIMIVMIWQFSGYVAVIFLAAIKNVPTNIINAAKLDGAYMPRIYRKIVIPQLKGAMGSCITILAMYALRSFDLIASLTGYTNTSSQTLPVLMYYEGFLKDNYAYAAAISCFLLALVLALILPLTYWTNRRKA